MTTLWQKTQLAPCLMTPRRHRKLWRGIWRLSAVEHPPVPCSTPSCRTSPPDAMLDGTRPAHTCSRRCSTTSSWCHRGQRVLTRVSKCCAQLCLTTLRHQGHHRTVPDDHMQPQHGRSWCSTTPRRESATLPMLDDRESSNTKFGANGAEERTKRYPYTLRSRESGL